MNMNSNSLFHRFIYVFLLSRGKSDDEIKGFNYYSKWQSESEVLSVEWLQLGMATVGHGRSNGRSQPVRGV